MEIFSLSSALYIAKIHIKIYNYLRLKQKLTIGVEELMEFNINCNYSGRFAVLPHAQLPSLQPTRVNRSFTKYEAVYNVSMLGLSCAINCNSRNGERSCFLAVSMTECITAYASAPRNVRKSPATFCFVFAGLTARSLALLSYGTSGLSRKVKI